MRSDEGCLDATSDLRMLTWFHLLPCSNHTNIHRDYWHRGKSLKRCRCTAAAVLLHTDFVASHSTHTYLVHTEAHIYAYTITQKQRL